MPCRVHGRRDCIQVNQYSTHNKDSKYDRLSASTVNLNEVENHNDTKIESPSSSMMPSLIVNVDFETKIPNLYPITAVQKKIRSNLNTDGEGIDLLSSRLSVISEKTNTMNKHTLDRSSSSHRFPKFGIGHIRSNDFICYGYRESKPIIEQQMPPVLLTTNLSVNKFSCPTAITIASGPIRSLSIFPPSNSLIKKAKCIDVKDRQTINSSTLSKAKCQSTTSFLKQADSTAFESIRSASNIPLNIINRQTKVNSSSIPMNIPKHKALVCGQKLTKVHISHAQSPSIIYLMLHENFNVACRLMYQMSQHPELQLDHTPNHPFQAEIDHVCACLYEGCWFRCRILKISSDLSTATVVNLDWGMVITVRIELSSIRRLPNEFCIEPVCSIMCQLDGVSNFRDFIPSNIIAQCNSLLSHSVYDVIVHDYHPMTGGKITLLINERNINEQIERLILPYKLLTSSKELTDEFQHQLRFSVGDELKALLSSFTGKDDSFYVLIINKTANAIGRAINELEDDHIPNREYLQIPQMKTLVLARYGDDGKYYRAWVKYVDTKNEQATVVYVDFGNESNVSFSDIYECPESVRTLPWLGIRVRLADETMTIEELITFWRLTETNYIWIRINEIFNDSYSIQVKIDYRVFIQQERLKMLSSKRFCDKIVQTKFNENNANLRNSSIRNSCLLISSKISQNQIENTNFLYELFEIINNELRLLRRRIIDRDEASQDRHNQLIQLLYSLIDSNINNYKKQSD